MEHNRVEIWKTRGVWHKDMTGGKAMRELGYEPPEAGRCLRELIRRLRRFEDFPHEIGLFLGYPLEDVKGFIVNAGKNSKSTGYWKVYGNVAESEKLFRCFKKCFTVMSSLFERGYSLPMLAVD